MSSSTPFAPTLGGDFEAGGHPQTPGREFPAPLFQQSVQGLYNSFLIRFCSFIPPQKLSSEEYGHLH